MICSIEECNRPRKARGWCSKHYNNWLRTGDPIPRRVIEYGRGWRVTVAGYVEIWEPTHPLAFSTGYVLEHRKVMWDAGLLTDPADHVHHIDHDKQNNDVINLVVMSSEDHSAHHAAENGYIKNQHGTWPTGQSVETQKRFHRERHRVLTEAASLLGLGYKEYVRAHGWSVVKAREIIRCF